MNSPSIVNIFVKLCLWPTTRFYTLFTIGTALQFDVVSHQQNGPAAALAICPLITKTKPDMKVVREEIFGPVVCGSPITDALRFGISQRGCNLPRRFLCAALDRWRGLAFRLRAPPPALAAIHAGRSGRQPITNPADNRKTGSARNCMFTSGALRPSLPNRMAR
jgi:hypothetical protein